MSKKLTPAEQSLSEVELFKRLEPSQIKKLAQVADITSVEAGKALITEGSMGRELIVLLDGAVDVQRGGQTIASLGPGDAVGEMALLDHQEASATVVTTAPSELLVVEGRRFKPLLDDMPGLAAALLASVCARLREADKAYDV